MQVAFGQHLDKKTGNNPLTPFFLPILANSRFTGLPNANRNRLHLILPFFACF
jgi:hypothetical protein